MKGYDQIIFVHILTRFIELDGFKLIRNLIGEVCLEDGVYHQKDENITNDKYD